jgi:hypothetical protein
MFQGEGVKFTCELETWITSTCANLLFHIFHVFYLGMSEILELSSHLLFLILGHWQVGPTQWRS